MKFHDNEIFYIILIVQKFGGWRGYGRIPYFYRFLSNIINMTNMTNNGNMVIIITFLELLREGSKIKKTNKKNKKVWSSTIKG